MRSQQLDLTLQERLADGDLARGGGTVAGWAPEHDVGDPDRGAVKADRRQHPVQQLAARSDEGLALAVLFGPWRLADQHQPGVGTAVREAQARCGLPQAAALEPVEGDLELCEASAPGRHQTRLRDAPPARTVRACGARHGRLGRSRRGCTSSVPRPGRGPRPHPGRPSAGTSRPKPRLRRPDEPTVSIHTLGLHEAGGLSIRNGQHRAGRGPRLGRMETASRRRVCGDVRSSGRERASRPGP